MEGKLIGREGGVESKIIGMESVDGGRKDKHIR